MGIAEAVKLGKKTYGEEKERLIGENTKRITNKETDLIDITHFQIFVIIGRSVCSKY